MNIKATPITAYKLELDGKPIVGEFALDSKWEGFVKFTNKTGETVIMGDECFTNVFERIFKGDATINGPVVKISPSLMPK